MKTIGEIRTDLIFSHPPGKVSGAAIVPPECFSDLDLEKIRLGCPTVWWYADDPYTGAKRPAFTPIQGGRLALILSKGIRHGDRFVGTIAIKEVLRQGQPRREMWMIDAQPIPQTL